MVGTLNVTPLYFTSLTMVTSCVLSIQMLTKHHQCNATVMNGDDVTTSVNYLYYSLALLL